jgi:protein-L-isoaspartate(D-aspartate) O-methyltransferase
MRLDNLIQILRDKGIHSETVLAALGKVPRHLFVHANQLDIAYLDQPLPIGYQQVITQPYLVAKMTEEVMKTNHVKKVLEIGTGSGYQAAVLAQLVEKVYSIERIKPLYEAAKLRLQELKITNVKLSYGDGNYGWPSYAPFDGIVVTAATEEPPVPLLEQLANNGRMVIPLGKRGGQHRLYSIIRHGNQFERSLLDFVLFVPLLPGKIKN